MISETPQRGYSGFGGGYHGGTAPFRIGRQGIGPGQTAGGPYPDLIYKKNDCESGAECFYKESA